MLAWAMATVLALSSLDSPTPLPEPPLPDWEQVTSVPAELHVPLQEQVVEAERKPVRRLERLVEWMFAPEGLAFEYDNAATRTVAETLRDRRGNCLSFTLTFVTLARQAGLEAHVQETDDVVVWPGSVDSNIVIHAGHVNAGVDIGRQHYTVDFEPNLVLSRNQPQEIDDRRVLAHFLNNRGVERFERNELADALRHFDAAVALEPGFVAGMNNIGVAHNRLGDAAASEQAYLAVLEIVPRHPPALSNLVSLYRHRGEIGKAARYERRLARSERRDPYRNFVVGLQHERRGEYEAALDAYRRAIRLHRGEPQFHLGLARVHALMGNGRESDRQRALAEAMKSRRSGPRGHDSSRARFHDMFQRRMSGAGIDAP